MTIPEHLKKYDWYESHQAWLRGEGGERANLRWADLRDAYLRDADLWDAYLRDADLQGADLSGADLTDTALWGADLSGANLSGADLRGAYLRDASLWGADLSGADLSGADLRGADLTGATLPDGRTLEQWQADPLAGLCTEPEAVERARAAWGNHSWTNCPMHAAHGWGSVLDAPEDKWSLVATFIALFDGGHLPKPGVKG